MSVGKREGKMVTVKSISSKEIRESLNNPATSYWLLKQLSESDKRDVVDMLIDVNILAEYLKKKADELEKYYLCYENGQFVEHNA